MSREPTITAYLEDEEDPSSRVFTIRLGCEDLHRLMTCLNKGGAGIFSDEFNNEVAELLERYLDKSAPSDREHAVRSGKLYQELSKYFDSDELRDLVGALILAGIGLREQGESCNYNAPDLDRAFIWSMTPQGHSFWNNLHDTYCRRSGRK